MERHKTKRRRSVATASSIQSSKSSSLPDFYLPEEECWESIFKFIANDHDLRYTYLNSISLVSKQFLSITDRLRFSLTICESTLPFLSSLLQRFINLISLNLGIFHGDKDALLRKISCLSLHLKSIDICFETTIPTKGLQAFSQTLTSLTCSDFGYIKGTELLLIAECFPLLEDLNLENPLELEINDENLRNGLKCLSSKLFKLRKVNLTGHYYINDQLLYDSFNNWKFLEKAVLFRCYEITNAGIAYAICEKPTFRSLSFCCNYKPKDSAILLAALVNKCPSLSEINLTYELWNNDLENFNPLMDVAISPQLKSLNLTTHYYYKLSDECIKIFAYLFPNLQQLNLSYCKNISDIAICEVLKRCCMITHLDLTYCSKLKLHGLNFEVPKLEVLNLSITNIDDETLYVISNRCRGLFHLLLENCHDITEKGVKQVVKNCIQLREINLKGCNKVHDNFVASLVSSRPSLRLITTPSILI